MAIREPGRFLNYFFLGKAEDGLVQLFRSLVMAIVAFAVDFLAMVALTEIGSMWYLTSAAFGFVMGLLVNYYLSICWTFSKRRVDSAWREFFIFTIIGVLGLGFLEIIIWGCTEQLGIHYMISKIIATVVVFFWNFLLRKIVLFT